MSKNILLALLFLLTPVAFAYDFRAVADGHLLPAYRKLMQTAARLDASAANYCDSPSDGAMQQLRADHALTFLAWQGAQHLRLGPIRYLAREHRFAMWPDKRGTVGRAESCVQFVHRHLGNERQVDAALGSVLVVPEHLVGGRCALGRLLIGCVKVVNDLVNFRPEDREGSVDGRRFEEHRILLLWFNIRGRIDHRRSLLEQFIARQQLAAT